MALREKKRAPKNVYVTFHTTVEAFALEEACKKAGIAGRLRTIPRSLSAGCGLAWASPVENSCALRALLKNQAAHIDYEDIAEL